jgi:hypothetical protein
VISTETTSFISVPKPDRRSGYRNADRHLSTETRFRSEYRITGWSDLANGYEYGYFLMSRVRRIIMIICRATSTSRCVAISGTETSTSTFMSSEYGPVSGSHRRRVRSACLPVGTVVRFIRHADPLKDFTGDATTKLPTLYEGVANDQLIRQWLSPDEVSLV